MSLCPPWFLAGFLVKFWILPLLGICQLCFSAAIRRELERILAVKFGWDKDEIDTRVATVLSWGIAVNPTVALSIVKDDPDDDRILECAIEAKAEAIVSGDRHLLKLGNFQGIPVCTPRQFLERLSRLHG